MNVPLTEISENRFAVYIVFDVNLEGKEFNYKFILDGKEWICDQTQRCTKTWEGILNNQLRIERRIFAPVGVFTDLRPARKIFNELHRILALEDYSEQHTYTYPGEVTLQIRKNPTTFQTYTLIARSSFHPQNLTSVQAIKLPGVIDRIEVTLKLALENENFSEDKKFINGLQGKLEFLNFADFGKTRRVLQEDQLDLTDIPPGFCVILKTKVQEEISTVVVNRFFEKLADFETTQELLEGIWIDQINHLL